MTALNTILPVFIMIALGYLARVKKWITPEQKDGANKIVFQILFPVMIFNALFTSQLRSNAVLHIAYIGVLWLIGMFVTHLLGNWIGKRFKHLAPFMVATCEGGNVALPLYTSIVGMKYMINTVTFDIAGTIIAFVIYPILVTKQTAGNASAKEIVHKVFTNSFVIATIIGLVFNLTGVYGMIEKNAIGTLYTSVISMITGPIVGMILFIIGYDLKIQPGMIKPLLKLAAVRMAIQVVIIIGFFLLFPSDMATKTFLLAVLIYFACPTGFAVPMQLTPIIGDEEDGSFLSAFISMYMVITLIVYTICVIFIA